MVVGKGVRNAEVEAKGYDREWGQGSFIFGRRQMHRLQMNRPGLWWRAKKKRF